MTGFDIAVLGSAVGIGLVAALYVRWASERFDEAHGKGKRHPAE